MARFLGIRHRVKKTSQGEARPTIVAIINDGETILRELPDDQAELDFAYCKFPIAFRPVEHEEDLAVFPAHQIKWRKLKKG
ncbi:MAG: hypothetical protein HY982_01730, partial [Candidatus Magasanikbacteria bacterium]|nr:hypothetical protein [Candidatus Magasanikbacteria bacterium]